MESKSPKAVTAKKADKKPTATKAKSAPATKTTPATASRVTKTTRKTELPTTTASTKPEKKVATAKPVKTAPKAKSATKETKATKKPLADKQKASLSVNSKQTPETTPELVAPAPQTTKTDEPKAPAAKVTAPETNHFEAKQIQVRRESFHPKNQQERKALKERVEKQDISDKNESYTNFPAPETVGGGDPNSNKRNKRRRRNKRGQNEERTEATPLAIKNIDNKELSKLAWKIFLGEVTEEGLALMDDQTARESARRAFRVAEFFLAEESRRKHAQHTNNKPVEQSKDDDDDQDDL